MPTMSALPTLARRALSTAVRRRPQLAKIVATIGPASEDQETLHAVVDAGMRVMRVNFSHATPDEVELRMKHLKTAKGRHGTMHVPHESFNLRATMLDTKGPEIRCGGLRVCRETGDRKAKIELKTGATVTLTTDKQYDGDGDADRLYVAYDDLARTVAAGSVVLLDDGLVSLVVKSVSPSGVEVECEVLNDGALGERKGVNLPGATTTLPPMSEKDEADIRYGVVAHDFDMIAASFVRKASDVAAIRAHVDVCVAERKAALGDGAVCIPPLIISKIESTEALENLDEILEASDGLMVARGDLGVEVPMAMVTLYQKEIVAKCNKVGKPVIVATQMLETMQGNPRPTRAEVADVTNAILDGADAVMLSGETANGKYPVESVATMNAIVQATEISSLAHAQPEWRAPPAAVVATDANAAAQDRDSTPTQHFEGLASAAVVAAAEIGATAIVVLTSTGRLARLVAKHRPTVPVVAFLGEAKVGRQLILHRSIHPVVAMRHEEPSQRPTRAVQHAKDMGFCAAGDRVVILLAEPETEVTKVSVTMRIAEVL